MSQANDALTGAAAVQRQQINLFNPAFREQKKFFTTLPMLEALGAIVVGALLLTWYASTQVKQLEEYAASGKILLAERERRLAQANRDFAPRQKNPALAAQLVEAEMELSSMHHVQGYLANGTLGNSAGYAEYFRAFARQNVNGLWLTGLAITGAGAQIGVQGRAMQPTLIPQYIARLTNESVMRGKTFSSLDISRPTALPVAAAAPAADASVANAAAPAAAAGMAPYVQFSLLSVVVEAPK